MVLEGVDVSVFQGNINWTAVANGQGISFAYIKTTESNNTTDRKFTVNWANCLAAGIQRGPYHYFHPDVDATDQTNHFLTVVRDTTSGFQGTDIAPALDIEEPLHGVSQTDYINGIQTWLNVVQAPPPPDGDGLGVPPVIYTNRITWNTLGNPTQFTGYELWIAEWGVKVPSLFGGWTNWKYWQYTYAGTVKGISGDVDMS